MTTPIIDFVKKYAFNSPLRAHMPGHKGKSFIGVENIDITEIDGADDLYHASGIIAESEKNASALFNAHTFYSTEGSTLSIKSMLYLAVKYAKEKGVKPVVAAGRNAHKAFLDAAALIGFDVKWIATKNSSYLSCNVTAETISNLFFNCDEKPFAVYLTTPDYLGNTIDVKAVSAICKAHGALLLVDNAHGAYTKFLTPSSHPIDLGADMCCDSAHKTLPVVTGGAYLHVCKDANPYFYKNAKYAMSLFGSTSPSYVILQSLDTVNAYLSDNYDKKLFDTVLRVAELKKKLSEFGYSIIGDEGLKITFDIKKFGYTGCEFNQVLKDNGIYSEFYDPDYLVLMLSPETEHDDILKLERILINLPKRTAIKGFNKKLTLPMVALSVRDAVFAPSETIDVHNAKGRIVSGETVACPPAVPIIVSGEIIDDNTIELFDYYGIKTCSVIKE